jgi:hypothetical protein
MLELTAVAVGVGDEGPAAATLWGEFLELTAVAVGVGDERPLWRRRRRGACGAGGFGARLEIPKEPDDDTTPRVKKERKKERAK